MPNNKKRKVPYDLSAYNTSRFEVVKKTFAKRFPTSSNKLQSPILIDAVESLRNKRQKQGDTRFFIWYKPISPILRRLSSSLDSMRKLL